MVLSSDSAGEMVYAESSDAAVIDQCSRPDYVAERSELTGLSNPAIENR